MPPKKSAASAAAGEEAKGPTLKLEVEKGPLSGQTRDFRPGSLVKIGRLVRGNTIAIKESGISSKHLLIESDAASDRWTITDLDSSNGTFLNDEQLEPSEPTALSDGDVIKIGEQTSIRVKFEIGGAENEDGSVNVRRNARRRVREKVPDLVVIEEDAEVGLQKIEDDGNLAEIEAKQGKNIGTKSTRSSAKNENLTKDLGPGGIQGSLGVSTRRTRTSRKEENVDEMVVDLSVIEGKNPRGRGRGRKKKPVEPICEEIEKEAPNPDPKTCDEEKEISESVVYELGIEAKNTSGTEGVDAGFTSTSGVEECNVEASKSGIEAKNTSETKGVDAGFTSTSGVEECNVEASKSGIEAKNTSETKGVDAGFTSTSGVEECNVETGKSGMEAKNTSGTKGVDAGLTSTSGVEECNVEAGKGKMELDLEKMTLGEWFDYMDVYVPRYIIDKSEEMLAEMRQKAERCHEYMLQQKRLRG